MNKNFFKKIPLLGMFLASCLAGCAPAGGGGDEPEVKDDGVTSIELRATGLSNDVLTIKEGKSTTIVASVKPTSATPDLKWTILDTSIAEMDGTKLNALKAGSTTLTVSAAKVSKSITVNVEGYVPLTAIKFDYTEDLVVEKGVRKQLKYSIEPENASTKTLNFSVSPAEQGVKINSSGIIEVDSKVDSGREFIVTATGTKETNIKATLKLIIKDYEVEDVRLLDNTFTKEVTSLNVPLDEPYRVLFAMIEPEKALPYEEKLPVVWSSSDTSVVKINEKGRMTFLKQGTSKITMSSTVKGKTFTKYCDVTVGEPSGDFIENYHIPASYISKVATNILPTGFGWQTFLDFRSGGTASIDAKKMVLENYQPQTGPSSWMSGGGYCIEMGGWDNIHSGLEDDDLPGGGMSNLIMWTKVKFGADASKIRTYFEYRSSDATFQYKLRHTLIDLSTREVLHLSDWQKSSMDYDPHFEGGESYIESSIPNSWRGKDLIMVLEYDDIDYTTDHILNGCDSVNIKYFNVLNDTGEFSNNALWIIGDSNTTTEFTGSLWADIAGDEKMDLFRDTISGRTIAPASSIGIVDHIDSQFYQNSFDPFCSPKVICIQCGGNDLYWANQPGNSLKIGEPTSEDKTCTYGAVKYVLKYFTTKYPNAKIVFANVKYRLTEGYTNIEADTFNTNIAEIVSHYANVSLFDMCGKLWNYAEQDETTYNSLFISDHIHFNSLGQSVMKGLWETEIEKVK